MRTSVRPACFPMEWLPVSQRIDVLLGVTQEIESRFPGCRLQPLHFIPFVIERIQNEYTNPHRARNGKGTIKPELTMLVNCARHFDGCHCALHCSPPLYRSNPGLLSTLAHQYTPLFHCLQCRPAPRPRRP